MLKKIGSSVLLFALVSSANAGSFLFAQSDSLQQEFFFKSSENYEVSENFRMPDADSQDEARLFNNGIAMHCVQRHKPSIQQNCEAGGFNGARFAIKTDYKSSQFGDSTAVCRITYACVVIATTKTANALVTDRLEKKQKK